MLKAIVSEERLGPAMTAEPSRSEPRAIDRGSFLAPESAGALFNLIGNSDLVLRGQALLVSIAPVKAALGDRWLQRRSQIYDLVERHFRKHLTPTDIWQRASETYFLVATPDKPTVLAQALCYRAMKDVMTYFLGDVQPEDLEVGLVTELSADHVGLRAYSVAELEKADVASTPATARQSAPASPLASLTSWPLKTADGQDLRVSFAVDPVMDLKAWAMAGHRIESRIVNLQSLVELTSAQRRMLMPPDFEKVDLAALDRGMSRLTGGPTPDKPNLIIQLSFASLSNGRARAALLNRARELQQVLRQAAICELVDVESGIPVGRLTEIASLVRGFFRSVWVQIEPTRSMVHTAGAAKISGLTVPAAMLGDDPQSIAVGMRRFVPMVTRPNTLLIVTSLPTTDLMIDAMSAGFTHATLRAMRPTPSAPTPAPVLVE